MPAIEMFVSLKVPDNVAITAFSTIKRMGDNQLKKLDRLDYYKFDVKNNIDKFKKQISNVDILVNANKHKCSFELGSNNKKDAKNKKDYYKQVNILVQDLDNGSGLLPTFRERLGFDNIKKLEKGTLWTMHFGKDTNAEKIALSITKNLLMNENYQKYKIINQSD